MANLPTHHMCIEVWHRGTSYYCISGTWYQQALLNEADLIIISNNLVHYEVRAKYDKYLEENSRALHGDELMLPMSED